MRFWVNWVRNSAPLLVKLSRKPFSTGPAPDMRALINSVGAKKGQVASTGRQQRSSFSEPPRGVYSKELLPEAGAPGV